MIMISRTHTMGRVGLQSLLEVHSGRASALTGKTKFIPLKSIVCSPLTQLVRCMAVLPKRERDFRTKVGIPDDYELIYKPPLSGHVNAAQGIGAFCALGVTASCGIQYFSTGGFTTFSSPGGISFVTESYEFLAYLVGFILLNVGVLWVASKYIIRIYKKDSSFIAVLPRGIPALHTTLKFSKGDVAQMRPRGIMPWKNNMFRIKKKSYIILSHHFRRPADFNAMLDTL